MKELRKESVKGLILLFILAILVNLVFVQAAIQTKNSRGLVTANFFTYDDIFLKSDSSLCNSVYQTVDVYIVNPGNTNLNDVRGEKQEVKLTDNYQISSNTKIWTADKAGYYDVLVDCDRDGFYNPLEPKTSFNVTFKKGTGEVVLGKEILGSSWQYDSEDIKLVKEVLELSLTTRGEDVELKNITIKANGDGNDTQIDKLEIYIDGNDNGLVDEDEIIIGDSQPAYVNDNGETIISLDHTLTSGVSENILVVYQMKQGINLGNFSLSVESVYGLGKESKETIKFSGLPINSNTLTVLLEKTCVGSLALELTPNPVIQGDNVLVKVSNLTGCGNLVFLRTAPCGDVSENINSGVLVNNLLQFNLMASESKTYYACTDKNNDGDWADFGEFASAGLIVNEKPVEGNIEIETNASISEIEENGSSSGITGGVIGFMEGSSTILVILEITLLLILFTLVVIAFRLKAGKGSRKVRNEEEGK